MRLCAGFRNAGPDDGVVAERHDHARPVALVQPRQRLDVEMVVVIVRDQDGVDARQVVEGHTRFIDAARADEAERAGAQRIDRVDQQVETPIW